LYDKSELQEILGVGRSIAKDLYDMGYTCVSDLACCSTEKMYEDLQNLRRTKIDRCVLYVFGCVVYFDSNTKHDPELLRWWNWKDKKR